MVHPRAILAQAAPHEESGLHTPHVGDGCAIQGKVFPRARLDHFLVLSSLLVGALIAAVCVGVICGWCSGSALTVLVLSYRPRPLTCCRRSAPRGSVSRLQSPQGQPHLKSTRLRPPAASMSILLRYRCLPGGTTSTTHSVLLAPQGERRIHVHRSVATPPRGNDVFVHTALGYSYRSVQTAVSE